MSSNGSRALTLAGFGIVLFFISVFVLLQLLPGPLTQRDYFIIGCLATLVSLFALFLLVITTWIKAPITFFRRRKR